MSLFTQRITEMIFESGETVQTLAETGKINRSTLQRVKSIAMEPTGREGKAPQPKPQQMVIVPGGKSTMDQLKTQVLQ